MRHPAVARVLGLATLCPLLFPAPGWAQCAHWSEGFCLESVEGPVHALEVHDDGGGPALYVGGEFTTAGDQLAAAIARWDGKAWSALGSGLAGGAPTRVACMTVFDDGLGGGPALYVGGEFTTAGGVAASGIARWDGAAWSALGSGIQGTVEALCAHDDGSGLALYAGGEFTTAGGVAAENIARWDGLSWSALGPGTDAAVHALAVHDPGGGPQLIAGGSFQQAGSAPAACVARWNGGAWAQVGDGLGSGEVRSLAVFDEGAGPRLFAGGELVTGGIYSAAIARLDGATWSQVGSGLSIYVTPWGPWASVHDLVVHDDGSGARLFAGGFFESSGLTSGLGHVAAWDGVSWSALAQGVGTGSAHRVDALAVFDETAGGGPRLFAGGEFHEASGAATSHLACWDGAAWSNSGFPAAGLLGGAAALEVYDPGSGPDLVASGSLTAAGGVPAAGIARWDGSAWHPLGAGLGIWQAHITSLAVFDPPGASKPGLYAAGTFQEIGGQSALRIGRWDGAGWSPLGSGLNHTVWALATVDLGGGPSLYAGGYFKTAGGVSARYVARWDGSQWHDVGGGAGLYVYSLLGSAAGPDGAPCLYVGGAFSTAGPVAAEHIARWDGSSWHALGGGLDDVPWSLAVFDGDLYVGGMFSQAGGQPAAHLARWDGSAWSEVGGGTDGVVNALGVWDDGSGSGAALYVGGKFQHAGSLAVGGLARWDGTEWSAVGDVVPIALGDLGSVKAFAPHDDGSGPALFVGGSFHLVDNVPSSAIARLANVCGTSPVAYCTAKVNSQGCTPAIGWSGTPSASAPTAFLVTAADVISQTNGILFYGVSGAASKPFQGGTLCVQGPVFRTPVQWSGGNPPPEDCSGAFALDFNALIQSGAPGLVPGVEVRAQYWYRDPASPSATGLSDAIAFGVGP